MITLTPTLTFATLKNIKVLSEHKHHFVPAFGFDGKLIGVCTVDEDCPVTISYIEIVRRINSEG